LVVLISPIQALQNLLSQFIDQWVITRGVAASQLGTPFWVEQFGNALELPGLWGEISGHLLTR
jgi:hypothetical protein